MAFLVRDLLQLTRFDNKQVRLDITKIEMNEFLSMTVRQKPNPCGSQASDADLRAI